MKKIGITGIILLLIFSFATIAQADLADFMRRVDAKAREDISSFNAKLSAQFGVPVPKVDQIIKQVANPADAFMVLQMSLMSHKEPETVVQTYTASKDKGWGAIAKELGIKPGSSEFHALKRGDFAFTGKPESSTKHGNSKGKGKGH